MIWRVKNIDIAVLGTIPESRIDSAGYLKLVLQVVSSNAFVKHSVPFSLIPLLLNSSNMVSIGGGVIWCSSNVFYLSRTRICTYKKVHRNINLIRYSIK